MLNADFFSGNRKKLLDSLETDSLVVVTAQGLMQRSGDTTFPFRQDSNFFYLTGLNIAELVMVATAKEQFIILPKRSEAEVIFGGTINCDEIANDSGISLILEHTNGWKKLSELQQYRKKVYTLANSPAKVAGVDSFYTNPARRSLIQKLKRLHPHLEIKDVRAHLVALRQIKQPVEVEAIKSAVEITKEGFLALKQHARSGIYEYELEAEFDRIFKRHNSGHGYQPIIAGGKQACVLHYIKNNQKLRGGELYLADVGAEYCNYSADITRTYGLNETERQKDVVAAVKRVQDYAVGLLAPGLDWHEYVATVEQAMGEELIKLNLISKNTKESVRQYFPHGISHSLGLDVHDPCDYKTIQENMVITVEPGIYVPEEEIAVRTEVNILITKTGAVNLSADIPY